MVSVQNVPFHHSTPVQVSNQPEPGIRQNLVPLCQLKSPVIDFINLEAVELLGKYCPC